MRRRPLLAAISTAASTGLAGCSLIDSDDRSRETFAVDETTPAPTTSLAIDAPPGAVEPSFDVPGYTLKRVAVTTPTGIPDDVAITLGFTSAPSETDPATLYVRVQARETASGPVELTTGPTPPLSSYRGGFDPEDGPRLTMSLVPRRAGVDDDDIVRRDRGCWRPVLPVGPDDASTGTRTLDPGAVLEREYYLVTPWANDRCLQPGTYRFETDAGWSFEVCQFEVASPGGSAFADADVPDLPGFARTRWYHTAAPERFLDPRTEEVGLPSATAAFTFHNQTDSRLRVHDRSWALYKLVEDRWHPLAPLDAPANDDATPVLPGETSTLSLSLFTDPDAPSDDERASIGGLSQGRYAVAYPLDVTLPGRAYPVSDPTAALLTVVGNDPAFTPTDAIDHVTDRDDVRHVHTTPDESAVATLRLQPATATNPPPLILEQVLQRDALRDAIHALRTAPDDVTAVVYHTTASTIENTVAWIDPSANGLTFTFDDDTYTMTYD
jgi:hypothetical protein